MNILTITIFLAYLCIIEESSLPILLDYENSHSVSFTFIANFVLWLKGCVHETKNGRPRQFTVLFHNDISNVNFTGNHFYLMVVCNIAQKIMLEKQ